MLQNLPKNKAEILQMILTFNTSFLIHSNPICENKSDFFVSEQIMFFNNFILE